MLALSTQQRAEPSWLNAHLPPCCRRVDSSDEDELERPVWQPRRPHLEFDDGYYEQDEDTEQEPPRQRKKAWRRVNPFIYSEAGMDGDANNEEESDDENDNLDGFIVAEDMELKINYQLSYIIRNFIVLVNSIIHHRPLYISHAFIAFY